MTSSTTSSSTISKRTTARSRLPQRLLPGGRTRGRPSGSSLRNCHDLDLVSNRTGTQAEWQEVVERMNGRGAGVADKDIPVLVQYLVKTYPTKK